MYLFNNCHDRKHTALYGPNAFFDLETSGYQATVADRLAKELIPGEHCIVATQDVTGDISYDGVNHAHMTRIRADKVRGIACELPPLEVDSDDGAEVLVLGWGSSLGAIRAAARRVRTNGHAVATAHLRHLHPLPTNLGEVLHRYERVLVPEMNSGQLAQLLRGEFLVDVESYTKLEGKPLFAAELEREMLERL